GEISEPRLSVIRSRLARGLVGCAGRTRRTHEDAVKGLAGVTVPRRESCDLQRVACRKYPTGTRQPEGGVELDARQVRAMAFRDSETKIDIGIFTYGEVRIHGSRTTPHLVRQQFAWPDCLCWAAGRGLAGQAWSRPVATPESYRRRARQCLTLADWAADET